MSGDDRVMQLVESALSQPRDRRESYVREQCGQDADLFREVWDAVQWEERMSGFLTQPMIMRTFGEDMPFQPGQLVEGRFEIQRELARGGMGIVYEAYDRKLDRRIALKCAKTAHRCHLAREVRNASEVSHPNVCKLYEIHTAFDATGDTDFITMEFLDGETLAARLRRGPLANKEADAIARQICAGVAEAHRNHVIHGDLKTANVILSPAPDGSERAVITDFGLAYSTGAAPGSIFDGEVGGTPGYMAPELRRGEKATVASDIYALGVMFREIFAGTDDDKWDRIAARCVDPDSSRRFASADKILKAAGPSQTRRVAMIGIAAALVAAATGLITYRGATAPKTTVRLAMGDIQAAAGAEPLASELARGLPGRLEKLKSSPATRFVFLPNAKKAEATHVLRGRLARDDGNLSLHTYVTEVRTGIDVREWAVRYAPDQWRYAVAAIPAIVTAAFELPRDAAAPVRDSARASLNQTLGFLRRYSQADVALGSAEQAVKLDPDSALTYAALAEAQWSKYFVTRDSQWLTRAADSARQADMRDPDAAAVHRIQGHLDAAAGRYEQAERHFRRAIQLDPKDGTAYRRLGTAYMSSNRWPEALASFQRAVEVEPDDFRSYQQLGSYFDRQSNYAEAAKQFRKSVDLAPDEPAVHRDLGRVYENLGRFTEAEVERRATLEIAQTPSAFHALGVNLMYQARDGEAVPLLRRAVAIQPDHFLWWLNLGTASRRAGSAGESRNAYVRGLELAEAEVRTNPRDGYVRAGLAYLAARLGDAKRAESEVAQALQLAPKDADTQWFAAVTYEALGRRDDAIAVLASSPAEVVSDVSRWPDVADLRRDSRFMRLLGSETKQGGR
jgi:serine/threonine-protein kinase